MSGATEGEALHPADSVHGHVVLRWLAERPMPIPELKARVARELGERVCFHTCDTNGLSCDALINLLVSRGKIVSGERGWSTDIARVCDDA